MSEESKNELMLPWETYLNKNCGNDLIITNGKNLVCQAGDNKSRDFILEAVNTFHDREELIKELVEWYENEHITGTTSLEMMEAMIKKAKETTKC